MRLGLSGKHAIVTGAASGIGRATVLQLTDEGCLVLAVDRDEAGLRMLREQREGSILTEQLDSASPEAAEITRGAVEQRLNGRLDILINNVGVAATRGGFLSVTREQWHDSFAVNFYSVVDQCRALMPFLLESQGVIVNVTSTSGRFPEPMLVDYSATKAAVISLTGALATEFGPRGVRVVAMAPGPTRTPLWDRPGGFVDALAERHGLGREEAIEHHITEVRRLALGKPGNATDAANAIVFLASDAAGQISGTTLAVHGGMATHLM